MSFDRSRREILAATIASLAYAHPAIAASTATARQLTLDGPDGRAIPLWHWTPRGRPIGTIAFSHGAASAPWKYDRLIGPWVEAGYAVFAPLHVDLTNHPRTAEFKGLASWKARIEDMRAVSRHIGGPYIAAGHSYGGLTALTLGGAEAVVPDGVKAPLRDPSVMAVVAFSPPAPIPVLITAAGYGALAVPALVQSGTADFLPGMDQTGEGWRGHLAAYDAAAPGGNRYAMVLDGVDHYFGGAICEPDRPGPPKFREIADAAQLSALFMQAFGNRLQPARRKLDARIGRRDGIEISRK
ncbi:alpha/beta fold hydrolase [Sphingobium sp. CR2-8]|uniref:alpha/beta hydrolase family protein n=1 Tax=Sphingobium sp. CR2-8 TaxID=1306534 RepID=UPI002DB8E596|nr:alpha/beta fold hydrolase [Sphingobium sp. CR2-8]MEC3911486.1 alpha/beta fold hydrolase [Sphingobium sp. CR2-8]